MNYMNIRYGIFGMDVGRETPAMSALFINALLGE